jgi:anti-anti-sigma factor
VGPLALNEVGSVDGSVALIVRGVVDDDTVELFERRLDLAVTGFGELVIDLTDCQLDSAGLAALIRLQRRSSDRARTTRLVATDVDALRMLQIVGLTRFRVYATLAAAQHSSRSVPRPIRHLRSVDGCGADPAWRALQ